MLTKIENNFGIISYNDKLVRSVVDHAVKPFLGKVLIRDLSFTITPGGVYVELTIQLAFGESISGATSQIASEIAKGIEDGLELRLNNVVVKINSIVSKRAVRRNITYDYARNILTYN